MCPLLTIGQLERTLGLLVQGEIDILLVTEEKETTGTKRKRKLNKTAVWKVRATTEILRGNERSSIFEGDERERTRQTASTT